MTGDGRERYLGISFDVHYHFGEAGHLCMVVLVPSEADRASVTPAALREFGRPHGDAAVWQRGAVEVGVKAGGVVVTLRSSAPAVCAEPFASAGSTRSSRSNKPGQLKDAGGMSDTKGGHASEARRAEPAVSPPEFDRDAAATAVGSGAESARGCGKTGGPTGRARVSVTFAPSGAVTEVSVGQPLADTPVGSCVTSAFKRVSVPPFSGGATTVSLALAIR
jgi:hypothetical protein